MKDGQFPLTFSHTKKMIEASRKTKAAHDELKEENITLKMEVEASKSTDAAITLYNEVKADKEKMKEELKVKDQLIEAEEKKVIKLEKERNKQNAVLKLLVKYKLENERHEREKKNLKAEVEKLRL